MEAASAAQAIERARRLDPDRAPDVLLTDMELTREGDGVDVALAFRRCFPEIKVIFATAATRTDTLARIASAEPDGILPKPTSPSQIRATLHSVRQAPSREGSS